MRRLFPIALALALGCGEIEFESPQANWPEPICAPEEEFDPETGRCRRPPCVWDDDCPAEQRCDRIEGRCVGRPRDPLAGGPWR
ncbi:MAG: hypothetical protein DIU72_002215 [Pseudomonadota bacterium]